MLTTIYTTFHTRLSLQYSRDDLFQAHAPDQAVRAYRERGMWDDALRVARHWRPELVRELESARYASSGAHGGAIAHSGSLESQLQRAKNFERQVLF